MYEECKSNDLKNLFKFIVLITLYMFGIMALVFGCHQMAHADSLDLNSQKSIDAIIGEAEGEGYEGMLAVAGAIRNRGNLKGVYGLRSPRVLKHLYSKQTYQLAVKAWEDSRNLIEREMIIHGATGWGNAKDIEEFKLHNWWRRCEITCVVGHHVFYNERS